MTQKQNDIKKMSFEDASKELEAIINEFEGEQVNLEDAIKNYSRAEALRQHCEKKLSEAKLKVEEITSSNNGKTTSKTFSEG